MSRYTWPTDDYSPNYNFTVFHGETEQFLPTPRNNPTKKRKNKKMAKDAKFRVIVKNGDTEWGKNKKTGAYESKDVDSVTDWDDLASALNEFLMFITDSYNEDKITLVYVPAKK